MVITHEQRGSNKSSKVGPLRKKFGSNFMNFGAIDN
jgi:hypothetical protein